MPDLAPAGQAIPTYRPPPRVSTYPGERSATIPTTQTAPFIILDPSPAAVSNPFTVMPPMPSPALVHPTFSNPLALGESESSKEKLGMSEESDKLNAIEERLRAIEGMDLYNSKYMPFQSH